MKVFCLDIGNTLAHWGVLSAGGVESSGSVATPLVISGGGLAGVFAELEVDTLAGVSFCSVVPGATAEATRQLPTLAGGRRVFHLTAATCPGLAIHYPRPAEIGQDRLANSIAAQALFGAPAVVIDMGTAVTFDLITPEGGYEGGIIAPGLSVMTRYLHEQTALLPELDPDSLIFSAGIGRSTVEAMKLGCAIGFSGMVRALLDQVLAEMDRLGHSGVNVVATGGSVGNLPRQWLAELKFDVDLTLKGLYEAFLRSATGIPEQL